MKIYLLTWGLWLTAAVSLFAQSRISIAPVYWFNYGIYSYQFHSVYNGSDTHVAGHDVASSVGLTARYHFTPKWTILVGILYNRNSSRLTSPTNPQGDNTPFVSEAIQLPVLVNYRLTSHRLSPYFSAGVFFVKSQTFTEAPIKTNGVIGVGLDYQLTSRLSLLLQPTGSHSFFKPDNDPLFQYSHYSTYSLGVQTQLIWHFK